MGPIINDIENTEEEGRTVSTPLIKKEYSCKINSKGIYNKQSYLINDIVKIYYDINKSKWTYVFTSKLSTRN